MNAVKKRKIFKWSEDKAFLVDLVKSGIPMQQVVIRTSASIYEKAKHLCPKEIKARQEKVILEKKRALAAQETDELPPSVIPITVIPPTEPTNNTFQAPLNVSRSPSVPLISSILPPIPIPLAEKKKSTKTNTRKKKMPRKRVLETSESEIEEKRKKEETDVSASETEGDYEKKNEIEQRIELREKNLQEIEDLEDLTAKVKKNKKFLKTVKLPEVPFSWTTAKELYSKRISVLHGRKKVVCSECHDLKPRGSAPHECSKSEHSFKNCPSKLLKGKFQSFFFDIS